MLSAVAATPYVMKVARLDQSDPFRRAVTMADPDGDSAVMPLALACGRRASISPPLSAIDRHAAALSGSSAARSTKSKLLLGDASGPLANVAINCRFGM